LLVHFSARNGFFRRNDASLTLGVRLLSGFALQLLHSVFGFCLAIRFKLSRLCGCAERTSWNNQRGSIFSVRAHCLRLVWRTAGVQNTESKSNNIAPSTKPNQSKFKSFASRKWNSSQHNGKSKPDAIFVQWME